MAAASKVNKSKTRKSTNRKPSSGFARLKKRLLSPVGLAVLLAFIVGGTVSGFHTLAPGAAADVNPDHSKGILVVEPVILPYCPPNADTCPGWENSFPYPYQLKIYQVNGSKQTLVYSADKYGPQNEAIKLMPGTYAIKYYAGTLKTVFPYPQTIQAGYITAPQKLHFYYPKDDTATYFVDYDNCAYYFTHTTQRGKHLCPISNPNPGPGMMLQVPGKL